MLPSTTPSNSRAVNPATGVELARYQLHEDQAVDRTLARLSAAERSWPRESYRARCERIANFADELIAARDRLAAIITAEMGKPLAQSLAEIDKTIDACRYVVLHADDWMRVRDVQLVDADARVEYRPLGTVLAVMPWNYPVWQVVRACLPSWLVGNAVVLKHAPCVPGVAVELESIARRAGLCEEAFASLRLSDSQVADVIADERIAGVTLTGSTRAGRSVAALAGAALKKSVLELGGSDPYVVLDDFDTHEAARIFVAARLQNCGQSCIAAKRLIVPSRRLAEFEDAVLEAVRAFRIGDPMDPQTLLGPLAREDLRDGVWAQVQRSREQGAKCLTAHPPGEQPGAWLHPAVLSGVGPGMAAFDEEIFGPVAVIVPAGSEREALALANSTPYGLGACLLSNDPDRAQSLAREELVAGMCWVNLSVRSDVRLPFGGVKASGYGRELGRECMGELANTKTIVTARR